jgi:uncharacterized membrane protein
MEIDQILGLPAHPLLVHIPVVLVPLATVGAVLVAVKASWRRSLAVVVAVLAVGGAVGVLLATQSGEALEERVEERTERPDGQVSAEGEEGDEVEDREAGEDREGGEDAERGEEAIEEHADKGEAARPFATLFALLAVGVAVVDHLSRREGIDDARKATLAKVLPVLLVLSVLSGGVASYMVYEAGHSGAKATWSET